MASHQLIDASLTALARRLPADAVDELADGLTETYQRHLSTGLDADAAAGAAITEFGDPDVVIAAFVRQAPGRRAARALLGWGRWSAPVGPRRWSPGTPGPGRYQTGPAGVRPDPAGEHRRARARRDRPAQLPPGPGSVSPAAWGCSSSTRPPLPASRWYHQSFTWPLAIAAVASLTRLTLSVRALPTARKLRSGTARRVSRKPDRAYGQRIVTPVPGGAIAPMEDRHSRPGRPGATTRKFPDT